MNVDASSHNITQNKLHVYPFALLQDCWFTALKTLTKLSASWSIDRLIKNSRHCLIYDETFIDIRLHLTSTDSRLLRKFYSTERIVGACFDHNERSQLKPESYALALSIWCAVLPTGNAFPKQKRSLQTWSTGVVGCAVVVLNTVKEALTRSPTESWPIRSASVQQAKRPLLGKLQTTRFNNGELVSKAVSKWIPHLAKALTLAFFPLYRQSLNCDRLTTAHETWVKLCINGS